MKNMLDTSKFFNKTLESTKRRVVLVLMLLFTIVYAGQANAQSKKVTIVTSGMTIIDVMHEIERQTGYMFVYNNKDINLNKVVKIDVANISVASVLETIFKSTDITYQMNGNNILLMTSAQKEQLQDAAKKGQDTHRQIVGTVKDKNGEPIIGASIKVKGSRGQGTMTDADGIFKLNVPDNSTIEVSYIGFITQETKVGNRKSFNIVLQEDKKILDEVVVVGYGNQRRVNIAGSVASVKGDDLIKSPVSTVSNALSGKMPGLVTLQSSGLPGSDNATLKIRGFDAPLVLIDGSEGDISTVDRFPF